MSQTGLHQRVLLTGGTGFVGRYVLGELVRRGHHAVCLVRSEDKLRAVMPEVDRRRVTSVPGTIFDRSPLRDAVSGADAVIHLVGIISEGRGGQTFDCIHRRGTAAVVEAAVNAGVRRFVHMSALGTRPDAVSKYHRSKWAAEQCVRVASLDWTIFRPSVIHGPDGEFMQLMKMMTCSLFPPVMPYFGSGRCRLQPISVGDVARCFVEALHRPETVGQVFEMGGAKTYNWKELYAACRRLIPGARRWKPAVGQPVLVAKLLAATVMKTPLVPARFRFNKAQIQMSQEDSVCDHTALESAFGITLGDFETELAAYAANIR